MFSSRSFFCSFDFFVYFFLLVLPLWKQLTGNHTELAPISFILYFTVLTETQKMCFTWCPIYDPISFLTSADDNSDWLEAQKPLNSSFTKLIFSFARINTGLYCIPAIIWKKKRETEREREKRKREKRKATLKYHMLWTRAPWHMHSSLGYFLWK